MPPLTPVDIVIGTSKIPTCVPDISKKWNRRWPNQWPQEGSLDVLIIRNMQALVKAYRAEEKSGKQGIIREKKRQRELGILQLFLDQSQNMSQGAESEKVGSQDEKVPLAAPIHPAQHQSHPNVDFLPSRDYDSMLAQEYRCRRDQVEEVGDNLRDSAESKMSRDIDKVGVNLQKALLETLISVGMQLETLTAIFNETLHQLSLGVFQRERGTCRVDNCDQMDQDSKANGSKVEERGCHSPPREVQRACIPQSTAGSPSKSVLAYPVATQAPMIKGQQPQGSSRTIRDLSGTEKTLPLLQEEEPDWMNIVHIESLGEQEHARAYVSRAYERCKEVTGHEAENIPFMEVTLREKIQQGLPGAVQEMLKEVIWLSDMTKQIYATHIDHYVTLFRDREMAERDKGQEVERRLREAQLKMLEESEEEEEKSAVQASIVNSQPCLWPVVVEHEQQVTQPVPSSQAPNQHVSSYQPFNNRKRRRMLDGNWQPVRSSFQQQGPVVVKLRGPCYVCGERTHFWRQCNTEDLTKDPCPLWRRGPQRREMLIPIRAVDRHQRGLFYREAENWREVDNQMMP